MSNLPHIMSRVLNQPLLMDPARARTFFAGLASRMGINRVFDVSGEVEGQEKLRIRAEGFTSSRERDRPYTVVDGIAVLPIEGTLVNKYGYVRPYSGMTGYDGILTRAADAFNDPNIRGVLMDNDTPGGDAAGCFDCTRTLREMAVASGKQLWALAYDMNCSGGMALASAASHRLITSTGYAGSIGVIMAHANYEKSLEEQGIDVTLIYAGAHKADGNPYSKLQSETYERFLAETEGLRQEFAELVAEFTGTSLQSILATEALSYRGEAAVNAGLADQVVNGNQAIQIFSDYLSGQGSTISLGATMSIEDTPKASAGPASASTSASAAPAADTEQTTEQKTATEAQKKQDDQGVRKAAVEEERARISAIMGCEEAQGRAGLANHFAMNTSMTPAEAKAALAAAPMEAAKATKTLDSMMAEEDVPKIGMDADSELSDQDQEFDSALAMFKSKSA